LKRLWFYPCLSKVLAGKSRLCAPEPLNYSFILRFKFVTQCYAARALGARAAFCVRQKVKHSQGGALKSLPWLCFTYSAKMPNPRQPKACRPAGTRQTQTGQTGAN